jgi:outer membrane lipoprotein carrier protein
MGIFLNKLVLILLLATLAAGTAAQSETPGYQPVEELEQVVSTLNDHSRTIETIQSLFIQRKQLEFLDETIISKGAFWFRKENSLRWAYTEPYEYAIILHQGKFIIIDGGEVNEYDIDSNEAFREINDLIIGMVQGRVLKQDKFSLEAFENRSTYLLKLVPLDPGIRGVISGMEIFFDRQDLDVTRIVIREGEKDYTEISFSDRLINETIPDTLFSAYM